VITIENGGLVVTGSASVTGTFIMSGDADFTGTVDISGPLTIQGETNITGNLTVAGPTKITGRTEVDGNFLVNGPMRTTGSLEVQGTTRLRGATTLENDLTVTNGGKITAGTVTIDPAHLSGSIRFANGSALSATPNGAQVSIVGGGSVGVAPTQAFMGYGGYGFLVDSGGMGVQGTLPTTPQPANVYINPSTGRMYLKA